ncbi:MAG: GreA/GreB family elongation factor [Candidatus Auribacterota bacterium]|nr:GreA/GreB family elongation factor [Candidatus Auribacterota bacterium]
MVEENKIYLTKDGLKKFEQEYQALERIKKMKTRNELPIVDSLDVLDSEFSTFEEDINLLEARLEELETILKNYTIITAPPKSKQKVIFIGATIIVEIEGQKDEFTIVGSLEANPLLGRISNASPVGMSLLGHKVGDEVKVQSAIISVYKIRKIAYKY